LYISYKLYIYIMLKVPSVEFALIMFSLTGILISFCHLGMIDAWSKIYRFEGASGLYRGFWVSTFQIVSGVFYISTYEGVRHVLTRYDADTRVKSLIAGGCASLVGQTIVVPFDVLSQHLMVLGVVNCRKENKVGIFYFIHKFFFITVTT